MNQPSSAAPVVAPQQLQPGQLGQPATVAAATQPPPPKPRRRVLTSLALQIFIYFGGWWDVAYYILNILVFIYKGIMLPYPNRNFAMEFSFAWLWILIEVPRLFLASKGNKTERSAPLMFSAILGMPILAMYVYFVAFQTYVLKADQLLNAVAIVFMGIQFIFALLAIIRFTLATRFAS